jgi:hypothetical protein
MMSVFEAMAKIRGGRRGSRKRGREVPKTTKLCFPTIVYIQSDNFYRAATIVTTDTYSVENLDLSPDHGGLIGFGISLLPALYADTVYQNIAEWDLSQAPEGTRAVWTFGEGPIPVVKVGPASILSESVYMVGQIHSKPPAPVPGAHLTPYYLL